MWDIFRKHHYLSNDFNKSAKLYLIFWDNVLVAMNSILNVPNGNVKNMFRSHRLVVLPDFQGLGIGTKINDFFGRYYLDHGLRYCMRTTHMKLINYMKNNINWIPTTNNNKNNVTRCEHNMKYANLMHNQKMLERICGSYEYVGPNYNNKKIIIIKELNKLEEQKLIDYLTELKKNHYIIIAHGTTQTKDNVDYIAQSLGIIVDPLYIKKNGQLNIKSKYKGLKCWEKEQNESINSL